MIPFNHLVQQHEETGTGGEEEEEKERTEEGKKERKEGKEEKGTVSRRFNQSYWTSQGCNQIKNI